MKTIRAKWAIDHCYNNFAKNDIEEKLGLILENEEEQLEIILINRFEHDFLNDGEIVIGVFSGGVALANLFIPFANIACIRLVTASI